MPVSLLRRMPKPKIHILYLCCMRIYLLGYMGCGKSTLGPKLADVLGIPFLDLDDHFEEMYRISINDFFTKYGEKRFRDFEHSLLTELSRQEEFVMATGGGTPCYLGNLDFMNRHGITLYLRLPYTLLAERLEQSQRKRPMLKEFIEGDFRAHIAGHLKEREQFYLQADILLDPMTVGPAEIAELIRQKLVIPAG